MDNAAVIGYGVVGQATANLFGIKLHFDVDPDRSNTSLEEVAKCRFIFICLPTPVEESGFYRTEHIESTIGQLQRLGTNAIIIIRSTVPPGFAKNLQQRIQYSRIISNPEFLSEDTATHDSTHPPFILLGGSEEGVLSEVKALYEGRLKSCPIILTDNTTAELAKISMNAYFSTKVIFANELYDAARKLDANYERIREILERHPFGPKNHFKVWYKGRRGVHGKCLPKDTMAFNFYTGSELTEKVMELNEEYSDLKE